MLFGGNFGKFWKKYTFEKKCSYKLAKKIIKSGLDLLIYSFDGGDKKTYEKMRIGRFKKNSFESVYKKGDLKRVNIF